MGDSIQELLPLTTAYATKQPVWILIPRNLFYFLFQDAKFHFQAIKLFRFFFWSDEIGSPRWRASTARFGRFIVEIDLGKGQHNLPLSCLSPPTGLARVFFWVFGVRQSKLGLGWLNASLEVHPGVQSKNPNRTSFRAVVLWSPFAVVDCGVASVSVWLS